MSLRRLFREAVAKGIIRRKIEPGPIEDAPALSDHDVARIRSEHILRKFGDVEFYGPNAEAANARREAEITRRDARILARIPAKEKAIAIVKAEDPQNATKKKRRRMTRRERLEKKAIDLRAEIERLKK